MRFIGVGNSRRLAAGRQHAGVKGRGRLRFGHPPPAAGAAHGGTNWTEELFARGLIGRWAIVVVWAVVGVFAAFRARATEHLLGLRGSSTRETEASLAEERLSRRFDSPVSEFFAVTLAAPPTFDAPEARFVLDSLAHILAAAPYVRGVVSYGSTSDTSFLSRDRRTTFLVVALRTATGDSAAGLVPVVRQTVRATLDRLPQGGRYTAHVTGRAPLDPGFGPVFALCGRSGQGPGSHRCTPSNPHVISGGRESGTFDQQILQVS